MSNKKQISHISFLQFIGPMFVILGHSLNGITESGLWYVLTKQWIYMFHMPLFFMISGYLLSNLGWIRNRSYSEFIKGKFLRLILPYLIWNGMFLIPKYFVNELLADNVEINIGYIFKIMVSPRQNIWGHTWFLVGLFIIYLFTPLWQRIFEGISVNKSIAVFLVGIMLYVLPLNTEVLCVTDLHKDIVFFWMGCILGQVNTDELYAKLVKYKYITYACAIIVSFLFLITKTSNRLWFIPCSFILCGLLTCGFTISGDSPIWKIISKYSVRSFGIYIMHWPVMIVCRVIMLQIAHLNITLTVASMIVLGYVIPNIIIALVKKFNRYSFAHIIGFMIGV